MRHPEQPGRCDRHLDHSSFSKAHCPAYFPLPSLMVTIIKPTARRYLGAGGRAAGAGLCVNSIERPMSLGHARQSLARRSCRMSSHSLPEAATAPVPAPLSPPIVFGLLNPGSGPFVKNGGVYKAGAAPRHFSFSSYLVFSILRSLSNIFLSTLHFDVQFDLDMGARRRRR